MTEIKEIKSVPIIPFAMIIAVIAIIITFLVGILNILLLLARGMAMTGLTKTIIPLIVIYPLSTFVSGFLICAIGALIYNRLAPRIGGIKLELE